MALSSQELEDFKQAIHFSHDRMAKEFLSHQHRFDVQDLSVCLNESLKTGKREHLSQLLIQALEQKDPTGSWLEVQHLQHAAMSSCDTLEPLIAVNPHVLDETLKHEIMNLYLTNFSWHRHIFLERMMAQTDVDPKEKTIQAGLKAIEYFVHMAQIHDMPWTDNQFIYTHLTSECLDSFDGIVYLDLCDHVWSFLKQHGLTYQPDKHDHPFFSFKDKDYPWTDVCELLRRHRFSLDEVIYVHDIYLPDHSGEGYPLWVYGTLRINAENPSSVHDYFSYLTDKVDLSWNPSKHLELLHEYHSKQHVDILQDALSRGILEQMVQRHHTHLASGTFKPRL